MAFKGLRYNEGKPRWSLLPYQALTYLMQIYEMGAQKYAPRNWEKGLSYSQTYDSLMRHLTKWYLREELDEESKLLHIAHATWNCLALLFYELNRNLYKKFDDRPKKKGK